MRKSPPVIGVSAVSFLEWFDTVSWLSGRDIRPLKPVSLISKGVLCQGSTKAVPLPQPFAALFPGPGEPVAEENFWTLWFKGRLTEADTPTIRLGATASGLTSSHLHHPPHILYRPDALSAAQQTVSKH